MANVLTPYEQKLLDIAMASNSTEMESMIYNKHGWATTIRNQADYDTLKRYNYDLDAYANDESTPTSRRLQKSEQRAVDSGTLQDKYGRLEYKNQLRDIVYNERDDAGLKSAFASVDEAAKKDIDYRGSEAENDAARYAAQRAKAKPLETAFDLGFKWVASTIGLGALNDILGKTGITAGLGDTPNPVDKGLTDLGKYKANEGISNWYDNTINPPNTELPSVYNGRVDPRVINTTGDGYRPPENPFTKNPNTNSPVVGNVDDVLKLQDQGNIQSFDSLNKGGSFQFAQNKARPFGQPEPETAFLTSDTASFGTVDENKKGGSTFRWA